MQHREVQWTVLQNASNLEVNAASARCHSRTCSRQAQAERTRITLGEQTQASVNRDDMMEPPPCSNAAWESVCRFRNLQKSGGCDHGTQRHASATCCHMAADSPSPSRHALPSYRAANGARCGHRAVGRRTRGTSLRVTIGCEIRGRCSCAAWCTLTCFTAPPRSLPVPRPLRCRNSQAAHSQG